MSDGHPLAFQLGRDVYPFVPVRRQAAARLDYQAFPLPCLHLCVRSLQIRHRSILQLQLQQYLLGADHVHVCSPKNVEDAGKRLIVADILDCRGYSWGIVVCPYQPP